MKFGLAAPHRGPLSNADDLRLIAERAEQLGYDYLSVSDHIVIPRQIADNYPYSDTGSFTASQQGMLDSMEQFTLLAWLAAATSKIGLLTSVIVVPHRNPLFMAKSLATTDVLSGGRVTVGCGAGWMREEFEALNLPDFDARGRVTTEYIEAMKVAWTSSDPAYDGEFSASITLMCSPALFQNHIHRSGLEAKAKQLRRVVAVGNGWYPFGSNPKFRMNTVAKYTARRDMLFALADAAGRDPESITLSYNSAFHHHTEQTSPDDDGRLAFTGTPEQRADDIQAFHAYAFATS